ncbi:MAG: hypothetical protein LUQ38_06375 [Methanotrichaceae archaeon]|nr:hypothetical protein [Methanotrichaceae archaeon]MDD1757884.1 hypothetical protein [Methanotrichaceae archaeon]
MQKLDEIRMAKEISFSFRHRPAAEVEASQVEQNRLAHLVVPYAGLCGIISLYNANASTA